MKQSIGNFLLGRLQEAGVRHIFGIRGDYNLGLMQQLEDRVSRLGLEIATSSMPLTRQMHMRESMALAR
jgi:TPP-dependent 2-oxoacid decarboxylase